jgi:Ca2+-binding RTX toxin-like protein
MFFWMVASLVTLVTISVIFALSAANTVSGSRADDISTAINANALKPPECASLNLTRIVVIGSNTPNNSSELILGTPGNDTINGGGGSDCILGGGGDDNLRGGNGVDILMGGPGNDAINGGGGADICYGGGQAGDTFASCSTIFP